jgi:hypothetical protein
MSIGYLKKCSDGTQPKKRFGSRAQAEDFRRAMIGSGRWTANGSNTYSCNVCGQYHAGRLGRVNRGGGRQTAKNKPRHLDCQ